MPFPQKHPAAQVVWHNEMQYSTAACLRGAATPRATSTQAVAPSVHMLTCCPAQRRAPPTSHALQQWRGSPHRNTHACPKNVRPSIEPGRAASRNEIDAAPPPHPGTQPLLPPTTERSHATTASLARTPPTPAAPFHPSPACPSPAQHSCTQVVWGAAVGGLTRTAFSSGSGVNSAAAGAAGSSSAPASTASRPAATVARRAIRAADRPPLQQQCAVAWDDGWGLGVDFGGAS